MTTEANLTTLDLCKRMSVTQMTIYNWRNQQDDPLPSHSTPIVTKNRVRFKHLEVMAWAKRNKRKYRWFGGNQFAEERSVKVKPVKKSKIRLKNPTPMPNIDYAPGNDLKA